MEIQVLTALAAMAQIIAAVFAYLAMKQAQVAISQADQSRRESVAPDWDFTGTDRSQAERSYWAESVILWNSGFGPARDCNVRFESANGQDLTHLAAFGRMGNGRVIMPDDTLRVAIHWEKESQPAGALWVGCTTRYGDRMMVRFDLKTDSNGELNLIATGERAWEGSREDSVART